MKMLNFPAAPIVIVGAKTSVVNFTTIGDVALAGINPPLVMISCHKKHLITEMIRHTGQFSINTTTPAMMATITYCARHSGRHVYKGHLQHHLTYDLPWLTASPGVFYCKVKETVTIETRTIFIAEVFATGGEATKEPILYTLNHQYNTLKSIECD